MAAASSAAVLLALVAAEAFAAAVEVWRQGFFPGPAAVVVVAGQLSVHLAAGQLESPGVALELVQLELAGASVLYQEQELALGALALA